MKQGDVALRPGIVIPVMGYVMSPAAAVAALIIVAHPGPYNHSLGARWGFGQIIMVSAWVLYKFGSQRIVLSPDVMRVVSFVQIWNVRRGGVQEIYLDDDLYALIIALTDGSTIEPFMFMIRGKVGLTRNSMSRETISDRITEWNADAPPDIEGYAGPLAWRQTRLNLLLLFTGSAMVAIEAIALTLANIW